MLSSMIVLGALLGSAGPAQAQNSEFPKPNLDVPAVLQDSTIFKYLSPEDKQNQWKPLEVGRDWSEITIPTIKPNALKLRVLLAVAERDFSNPDYSNTLEMRDKTRLLEAMGRLKSLFAIISDGSINFEYVPRFIPEAIFDVRELKQVINAEFNKSKFESDDSVERGPFAAVIALSGSHVTDQAQPGEDYVVHGMSDLGGCGQDMWLEESLFYVVQSGIFNRMSSHYSGFKAGFTTQESRTFLMDRLATFRGDYQKFFDPSFRKDVDMVSSWGQLSVNAPLRAQRGPNMAAVQTPGAISLIDGALNYSELSILRAGEFALPPSDKWGTQKILKFEFRTKNRNPIAVKLWKKDGTKQEIILGRESGMIPVPTDFSWQPITIGLPAEGVTGATIGTPSSYFGKTRIRAELMQCDFRNFELVSDGNAVTPGVVPTVTFDTEAAIREALTSGTKTMKRKALANVDAIKGMKGLESALLAAAGDIDAGVAHDACRDYFELVLSGTPSPEELATMKGFLIAPPSETVREVALSFTTRSTAYASFDTVIGNTVRESWRVRRAATLALAALARANVKEKEGCHQTLLTSTGQEMALIRLAAVSQLDPAVKVDAQRLEFLMINDPCESVRLASLRSLAASNSIPKEKLFGCLADDSPSLRERIPAALGAKNPFLREALQKLIIDQDAYVRLSAIQNFSELGNVQQGEIQNVFTDKHPAVQVALLQGAASGAWKIPADALARLKESPIPAVKNLAMEIR